MSRVLGGFPQRGTAHPAVLGLRPVPPSSHAHVPGVLLLDYGWTRVSGRGFVYSYVIVRHPVHPAIAEKEQTPYNVCMIEMEEQEGLRLCSNVLNVAPEDIHIDMPVLVSFFPAADDPMWCCRFSCPLRSEQASPDLPGGKPSCKFSSRY